ncbi:SDR family oxidoreductase [Tianweitania sediminis]|uniref:SDR family oxidoreductase n=1 Tax=Tianweitania sediminis TaxID=1502156 RepID=A0A8J7R439_9HYPH|nr:SDR family oxidoreductase [Tianweitania sediminis]MBP0440713.1 SDR family oxidoreductase [Tianweitania sediminis]
MKYEDLVVVITGASSGIGQATAEAFSRLRSRIVIASRNGEALEDVAQNCRQLGGTISVFPTDVTDESAVQRLAAHAVEQFGGVDVWVSNVGIGTVGRFEQTPMEAHRQVILASLIGHMHDMHAVLPIFLKQSRGIFINMISLGSYTALPFAASYTASKFGLRGFSEALRAELADRPGIHICDVHPAFVDTPAIGHAGNYVGKELTMPPPLLDPRVVAAAVVRLVKHPRATTMVGWSGVAVRAAHSLAPDFVARSMAGVMKRYFARAKTIMVRNGNLYEPPAIPGGIDGGLRSPGGRATLLVGLGIVGALLALFAIGRSTGFGRPIRRRKRRLFSR